MQRRHIWRSLKGHAICPPKCQYFFAKAKFYLPGVNCEKVYLKKNIHIYIVLVLEVWENSEKSPKYCFPQSIYSGYGGNPHFT